MNRKIIVIAIAFLLVGTTAGAGAWLWTTGYLKSILGRGVEPAIAVPNSNGRIPRNAILLVRKLSRVHDEMAKGNQAAVGQLDEVVIGISGVFEQFDRVDWQSPKNVNAMMTYVLSGGKAEAVKNFVEAKTGTSDQLALAKGAMYFSMHRLETALKLIGGVDPRALERSLAGPMALALASLHATEEPQRGVQLFDEARLQAPGTAIEEAAIRREVPVLLKQGDIRRATGLASRYVRSFGRSLFSTKFYQDLATGLAASDESQAVAAIEELSVSIEREPDDIRADLYLKVSRAAVVSGKLNLCKKAAKKIIVMLPDGSPSKSKAQLYSAAASAPTEDARTAIVDLDAVPLGDLDTDEIAIREAAKTIAGYINVAGTTSSTMDQTGSQIRGDPERSEASGSAPVEAPDVLRRVQAAIKEADILLTMENR